MRRKTHARSTLMDFLFTLSLFCVFTATAFLVVMIGANAYRSTVQHMDDTYSTRTSLAYVTEKIRQHDEAGRISLTEVNGSTALLLHDQTGDAAYETYIYPDGEYICELVLREGDEFSPDRGDPVVRVKNFSIEETGDGFLKLSAEDNDGNSVSFFLHLRNDERI